MEPDQQSGLEIEEFIDSYETRSVTARVERHADDWVDVNLDDDSLDGLQYVASIMAVCNEEGTINVIVASEDDEHLNLAPEAAASLIDDLSIRLLDCMPDAFPKLKPLLLQMFTEWAEKSQLTNV